MTPCERRGSVEASSFQKGSAKETHSSLWAQEPDALKVKHTEGKMGGTVVRRGEVHSRGAMM